MEIGFITHCHVIILLSKHHHHTQQGFIISQLYTFALFLAFSYCQNTPGLFAAFGFNYTTKTPMPVFVGLMLFSTTFWSPVDKVLLSYSMYSNYEIFAPLLL
jgi:hypothetical protein